MKTNFRTFKSQPFLALKRRATRAFTLVEVSLSLGIMAFAMVPIFSLLPIGMSMQRDSIDRTVAAQVLQTIVGDLQRSNFGTLVAIDGAGNATAVKSMFAAGNENLRYFDDEGNEVESGSPKRIIDVQTSLVFPAEIPGTSADNYNMAQAEIRIARNPALLGGGELFEDKTQAYDDRYQTHFALIARTID